MRNSFVLGRWIPAWCALVSLTAFAVEPDVRRDATVDAIEQVMPCVVNIATRTVVPISDPWTAMWRRYYGQQASDTLVSLGSGVIIDEAGYLLTNDHVVRRADQIGVKFNTGTNVYEATIIASDPKRDVALLKLKKLKEFPDEKFHAIKLARDDDLLLGETVLALGNPFGLGGTVTRGILSSKSRTMPKEGASLDIPNWLQTDAPINPGNSGGPLVNLHGELIGINVAVFNETEKGEPVQGIGFAIPIRLVEDALGNLLSTEFVKSSWFGARMKVGTSPLMISSVQPASPAEKAGLKAGDTILQVNGKAPKSFIDFSELLGTNAAADVTFSVQSEGEQKNVVVRLLPVDSVFNAGLIREKLGLSLEPRTLQMPRGALKTFVITKVEKDSPADGARVQNGMFITAIDGAAPEDLTALAKLIFGKKKGERVQLNLLTLLRENNYSMSLQEWQAELTPR